jgi:hypothetical protein
VDESPLDFASLFVTGYRFSQRTTSGADAFSNNCTKPLLLGEQFTTGILRRPVRQRTACRE